VTLKIAFGKGRGAAECIRLLDPGVPEEVCAAKKLVHRSADGTIEALIVRGPDLSQFLREKWVDVAVGSGILFAEHGGEEAGLVKLASLNIGICRLSLISPPEQPIAEIRTIAARYYHTAARLIAGRVPPSVRFIGFGGCLEVALHLGACEAIVDIVETGTTIRTMNFVEREVLLPIRHEIWCRREDEGSPRKIRELLHR
jgi:ATP phosphoribosyltransferase